MGNNWSLQIFLVGPHGERLGMAISLAEEIASDLQRIEPPDAGLAVFGIGPTFDEVIKTLKRREFRKSLFQQEAARLGALLAERMEDAEGWHDVERIEPAKRQLGVFR